MILSKYKSSKLNLFQCLLKHPNARLASIHSFDEQFFIDEILLSISSQGFDFWIGLHKSSKGINFKLAKLRILHY